MFVGPEAGNFRDGSNSLRACAQYPKEKQDLAEQAEANRIAREHGISAEAFRRTKRAEEHYGNPSPEPSSEELAKETPEEKLAREEKEKQDLSKNQNEKENFTRTPSGSPAISG